MTSLIHSTLAAAASLSLLTACGPQAPAAPTVPAVFVTEVRNDLGANQRRFSASLRPRWETSLGFRVGGKVAVRSVELGQAVRQGQALGRIDPADFQLAVLAAAEQERAAQVDALQSASDAARFKRLLADGSVGAADAERQQARADAAAARWAQAQSQSELARNRAAYAVLTAPFDGVVTAVQFEPGQVVSEGQPLVTLAQPGALELQVDVPEALVSGLAGWQASATVGEGSPPVPVRLRELAPSAASVSRTFRARYAMGPLPAGTPWRMGMSAELLLRQPGRSPGAQLPVSALLMTGASPAVWLVEPSTDALLRTPVEVLSQGTDHVRLGGLADGAWVVSVGVQKLDAGMKVRPVQRPVAARSGTGAAAPLGVVVQR